MGQEDHQDPIFFPVQFHVLDLGLLSLGHASSQSYHAAWIP